MNKDKIIKDLKERNDKLAHQSKQHEMREHHYLYKCEQLEKQVKELEEENNTLKELNVCVGCDNNPDYKSRIDKAIEYIEENTEY